MNIDTPALHSLIESYARFNAKRALGDGRDSEFRSQRFGDANANADASAIAMVDPARPGSTMCNRVLGFCEETLPHLKEILAFYKKAGQPPFFDIAADHLFPGVIEPLIEHEFGASDALTYLSGNPAEMRLRKPNDAIRIERWEHDRADDFLSLLETSGVTCAPEVWEDRRHCYCTDQFRVFVASSNDQPCAWATLFVDGKQGYFANAWTRTDARKQGCQTALLRARVADAAELGLTQVFTDVVAKSQSLQNCKRAGFGNATVITQWAKGA